MSKANSSKHARLLDAAGRTFAEKGYRAATIREICQLAGASVAAVNYHFGSKRRLYAEVLSSILRYTMEKYPPELGQAEARTAEERLCALVRSFLLRRLDPDRPTWHRRLLRREMDEPSPMKRVLIEKVIARTRALLRGIVIELLGGDRSRAAGVSDEYIDLCMASVAGQCLYYQQRQHMVAHGLRPATFTSAGIDKLARHIAAFSVAGLRGTRPPVEER